MYGEYLLLIILNFFILYDALYYETPLKISNDRSKDYIASDLTFLHLILKKTSFEDIFLH